MQRIDVLRTLAMSSALILAISGTACASDEDTGEKGETPGVEAVSPAEAAEDVEAAPPAKAAEEAPEEPDASEEKSEEEASEAEEE
jgi:hypothetical protein